MSKDLSGEINAAQKELQVNPEGYERQLLAVLVQRPAEFTKLQRFLPEGCFETGRFNTLLQAVRLFSSQTGGSSSEPIPRDYLTAFFVDRVNSGAIERQVHDDLVNDLDVDLYPMQLPPELVKSVTGKLFKAWTEARVVRQTVSYLVNKANLYPVGLRDISEALQHAQQNCPPATDLCEAKPIGELACDPANDPGELLCHRFLCLSGILLLVGPTGIGKSSLVVFFTLLWALGRAAFGIHPKRPIKSLIVQAENDTGDTVEMRDGVAAGLELSAEEKQSAFANVLVVREDTRTGETFCREGVRPLLEQHRPDLLVIDPGLAYLGGETSSQKDVGTFLRNNLNPLLREFNCACVIVHHVNKPSKGGHHVDQSEMSYIGSGSAEWANVPRAVLALLPVVGARGIYELRAGKRGNRLGWQDDGGQPVFHKHIAHSRTQGQISWREAETSEIPATATRKKSGSPEVQGLVLESIREGAAIEKKDLLEILADQGVRRGLVRESIDVLISAGMLKQEKRKRPGGGRDQVYLTRPRANGHEVMFSHPSKKGDPGEIVIVSPPKITTPTTTTIP